MNTSRRRCWKLLSAGPVLAGLSACGFHLRSAGDYPFKTLFANFSTNSPLGVELRRNLLGTGRITLLTEPTQMTTADAVLDILSEERQQAVVGVNASGQVRELQLRLRVRFRLRTPQGQMLIEPVELAQQRDLSFTETAALSKEIEQATMYRDMQTDIVQQIMRRLSAVKPRAVPTGKP
ncbi:MAG: LPS assembly lipoprotein LptE [Limnohabitans sp.]|jgi:LPS-assembly lipoprotein|nr:LPS assembly lipoprotein LptE [Limnohabitans sp.]MDP4771701.1 LPS assembly lipoprotein LptE [Limnohabitans sp.]MDP4923396.1 LPS assembly lipoprotein LptE [Limnohabitans sp.]